MKHRATTADGPPAEGPAADGSGAAVAKMGRAGGLSLAGAAVSAVAGVAVTVVITNALDKQAAGAVFAGTALFLIATAIVQLGTDVGVVRAIPTLIVQDRGRQIRPVLLIALLPVLIASTLAGAAGYLFADQIADLIVADAEQTSIADQLRVLAVFLPAAAVGNVLMAVSRGFRTMVPTVVVDSLLKVVLQLALVGAVVVLGLGAVAVVIAWSLPFAVALVCILAWVIALVRRQDRRDRRARAGAPAPAAGEGGAKALTGEFWRFTGPRALATTSQMALKRADILLVAALQSSAEAALYAAATRFVVLGQIGVQALQQALSPQLSAMFAHKDVRGVAEVFRATTAWSMILAWPIYLLCAVFAPQLLKIFGDGYTEAVPIVVILCLTMLAATAAGAVDSVLLMSGRTWLSLFNNVGALALNLALNVVLIPIYGALGAAVAWAVAIVVRNALPLVQTRLMYGVSPVSKASLVVGATAMVCFGLIPAAFVWAGAGFVPSVAAAVAGALGYAGVLVAFRRLLHLGALLQALRSAARGRGGKGGRG